MLLVRILLAVISIASALSAVVASLINCSYLFDKSQYTPSKQKKAEIAYWISFAIACLAGCFFVLWTLAEVIVNHSIIDFILLGAYAILLYKYGDI